MSCKLSPRVAGVKTAILALILCLYPMAGFSLPWKGLFSRSCENVHLAEELMNSIKYQADLSNQGLSFIRTNIFHYKYFFSLPYQYLYMWGRRIVADRIFEVILGLKENDYQPLTSIEEREAYEAILGLDMLIGMQRYWNKAIRAGFTTDKKSIESASSFWFRVRNDVEKLDLLQKLQPYAKRLATGDAKKEMLYYRDNEIRWFARVHKIDEHSTRTALVNGFNAANTGTNFDNVIAVKIEGPLGDTYPLIADVEALMVDGSILKSRFRYEGFNTHGGILPQ
jgi:hypothetical protein